MIVQFHRVQKYYGATLVLSDINLEVKEGEKVGLIGRNGTGKSTILRLIAGDLSPDGGHISIRKGAKIGYLAQTADGDGRSTVYDVLSYAYREVKECQAKMAELESLMAQPQVTADTERMEAVLRQYAELQERFEQAGGYEMEARIDQVASGLGIPASHYTRLYASLSGGEQTKAGLASLLIARPTLLLLDEPTNHLDMSAVEWLESYLSAYEGTCIIVSHDRYFLDRVVAKIVEIEDGEATTYYTNYTGYQEEKQQRLLQQFAEYKDQQKKIKQMKEAIKRYREWGQIGDNPKFFRRAAAIQKALDRMEKVKRPVMDRKAADFRLELAGRSGNDAAKLDNVSKAYGDRLLFRHVSGLLEYGDKVALIGDNGAGKSTLFKLLLGIEQPDEGDVKLGSRAVIGYLAQDEPPQHDLTVLQYFRDEAGLEEGEARGRLAAYLFYGADVFKSVKNLSGGEWTRLRLALLIHRMPNLLLLDEPTNHLDIASREALEETLEQFPGTVLAVSHDRYFINRIASKIWALHDRTLAVYQGNFDEYKEQQAKRTRMSDERRVSDERKNSVRRDGISPASRGKETSNRRQVRLALRLEQDIERIEKQIAGLDEELARPEIYADSLRTSELALQKERLQKKAAELYEQWMELQQEES